MRFRVQALGFKYSCTRLHIEGVEVGTVIVPDHLGKVDESLGFRGYKGLGFRVTSDCPQRGPILYRSERQCSFIEL